MFDLIQKIHASEIVFEIAVTGGGSSAISQMLGVPGASASILNAVIPYSASALSNYLGTTVEQSCSEKTARLMATRAFYSAQTLANDATSLFGIGATAALQTGRTRRGTDRVHVAVQSKTHTRTYGLDLDAALSRSEQETLVAELIIQVIGSAAGHFAINPQKEVFAPANLQALMTGDTLKSDTETHTVIFPGAFNPPHIGHFEMAKVAAQQLQSTVTFEISAFNVDKPPLDYIDMQERRDALEGQRHIFTHAATFLEKSALFPGCTFIVGTDTLVRIDDPKYYGGSEHNRNNAIEVFTSGGHTFLTFGRKVSGQPYLGLADVNISPRLRALCQEIPEAAFREDISSTELRQ